VPVMSPQQREQIRERIEAAAIRCFVTKGFHGTTTRQIATGAGLSTGGIYAHYAGKEELYSSILASYRRTFSQPDNPLFIYFEASQFPDDIPLLAAAIEALIERHSDFWKLWYVDVLEFQGRHFAGNFLNDGPTHPKLVARFAELDAEGRLSMPANVAFQVVYMHLFNHLLVQILFGGRETSAVPPDVALRAIEQISLHGILASHPTG
jgi:AcrR family transcriptional regulator